MRLVRCDAAESTASGTLDASAPMLWCSATQYRL